MRYVFERKRLADAGLGNAAFNLYRKWEEIQDTGDGAGLGLSYASTGEIVPANGLGLLTGAIRGLGGRPIVRVGKEVGGRENRGRATPCPKPGDCNGEVGAWILTGYAREVDTRLGGLSDIELSGVPPWLG